MDILEGMAEEIFKYTAYPSDSQIEEAATVLVHTHSCLKERGTLVKQDSLEKERVVLLTEVKKRNNDAVVKKKMQKTFAYRRQEVVQDAPVVAELINAEFMRITTLPLQAKFLAELDRYSPNLLKVFHNRGGDAGRKIRLLMAPTARNVRSEEAESAIPQTTLGLHVIRNEGAHEKNGTEDVVVIIEGMEQLKVA
ncbi:hypothetical protein NQZ68_033874 [Dissostichus eleginoides]|nr:hypothetical protein NQZ68_033874 [Dissostichus eleginoides]